MVAAHTAHVVAVNVGAVREVVHHGRPVTTAIFKEPVEGRVGTAGVNLAGDDQADRRAHGGPDRALYAYAMEDLAWWSGEEGRSIGPGSMGENLTTGGLDVTASRIGDQWQVGTAVLMVTAPRVPCFKLGIRMGDGRFPQRFAAAGRPGAYLRIIEHGEIGAGDAIEVVHRSGHDVTIDLVARAYHDDRSLAPLLLAAPELGGGWREWATRMAG